MSDEPQPPIETDCQTVKRLLDAGGPSFLLLDCREQDEYDLVKITGAVLLPMSQMMARSQELDEHRRKHIVVHCHHGGRSLRVAAWLRENGFPNTQSMAGGIDRWAQEIDTSSPRY